MSILNLVRGTRFKNTSLLRKLGMFIRPGKQNIVLVSGR